MPRTTRATAKAQEAEQPVMSTDTRNGVTNSNNPDIVVDSDQPEPKKAKGKKKGKSKKNKKNKLQDGDEAGLAESEEPLVEANQEEKTGVEEPEPVVSADRDHQNNDIIDQVVERPASPAVKMEHIAEISVLSNMNEPNSSNVPITLREDEDTESGAVQDAEPEEAIEKIITADNISSSETAPLSTSDSAPEPKLPSQATSLLTSPTIAMSPTSDPIDAIDALEDALEEVGRILPKVEPMSPEKPTRKHAPTRIKDVKPIAPILQAKPTKSSAKSTPKPTSTLNKSTQPSALARSTSIRATPAARAAKATTVAKTNTASKRQSVIAPKDGEKTPSTATDYLASKRRPISIHFPTPPPPAKSSKPPTKPTFSLPGDALMAKRRAALEEKLRKEQDEIAKKREFKARPAPNTSKPRPVSMIVRQNTNSLARRSVMGLPDAAATGQDIPKAPATTLRRAGTVTGASTATKERLAARRASIQLSKSTATPSANTASKRQSVLLGPKSDPSKPTNPKRSSIIVPKRQPNPPTTTTTTTTRTPSTTTSTSKPPTARSTTRTVSTAEDKKAKVIYNRDKIDKTDKDRHEKEAAAAKARAEAAEKGRAASREWAEKQKRKLARAVSREVQPAAETVAGRMDGDVNGGQVVAA